MCGRKIKVEEGRKKGRKNRKRRGNRKEDR